MILEAIDKTAGSTIIRTLTAFSSVDVDDELLIIN